MQMVKKAAILFLLLWLAFIVFMPKEELYFSVEKVLAKEGIEINEENLSEGMFSLDLQGLSVYVKGIKIARVRKAQGFTLLFYSRVAIEGVKIDKALSTMLPTKIDKVLLSHSVLAPLHVVLKAEGDFGTARGNIDLAERKIHVDFNQTGKLGPLRSQLKKGKEGWYYETRY